MRPERLLRRANGECGKTNAEWHSFAPLSRAKTSPFSFLLSPSPPPRPFVSPARDGTIIEDRHYLADPAGVALCASAASGLLRLQRAGFRLVVISNQSGIGRGLMTEAEVRAVNDRMAALLGEAGVTLDGIYWCPHAPDADCDCRKPRPGLVHRALRDLNGGLTGAWMIGDKRLDLELGRQLGLPGILVRTGHGRSEEAALASPPAAVTNDIGAAAAFVLDHREANFW
jgi:D-glycero-D-manno-heptose 1,7-bisphosphate phosphatase